MEVEVEVVRIDEGFCRKGRRIPVFRSRYDGFCLMSGLGRMRGEVGLGLGYAGTRLDGISSACETED